MVRGDDPRAYFQRPSDFISERLAPDRLSAFARACRVARLNHEAFDVATSASDQFGAPRRSEASYLTDETGSHCIALSRTVRGSSIGSNATSVSACSRCVAPHVSHLGSLGHRFAEHLNLQRVSRQQAGVSMY